MEGPQPPVPLADPHAGLIRLQHAAGEQTGADQAPLPGEGRPAVGQHGDQGALADRKPKQIGHQPHQPLERDRMDEPQIDDKGPQVRTERRAGRHVGRRFGPERLAAAGAEPAIQRHPRDVRLDRGKLDVVVGVERGLRDARQVGPAMSAMIGQDVALARRIGMQGTVRSGMRCASARAPVRRRRVGRRLPALRGRRAGIVRRLRWQLQLLTQRRVLRPQRSVICLQAGQPRRQHLHLPVQRGDRLRLRQDQADQGFLVERIEGLTILQSLNQRPPALSKPHLNPPRTINPEIGLSNYE